MPGVGASAALGRRSFSLGCSLGGGHLPRLTGDLALLLGGRHRVQPARRCWRRPCCLGLLRGLFGRRGSGCLDLAGDDLVGALPIDRLAVLRPERAGGDSCLEVRIGQGELEYGRVVTHLERCGYARCLTVDVRDVADSPFPVEPEVRKLKYLLESLV